MRTFYPAVPNRKRATPPMLRIVNIFIASTRKIHQPCLPWVGPLGPVAQDRVDPVRAEPRRAIS
jgi:hypothetical protein